MSGRSQLGVGRGAEHDIRMMWKSRYDAATLAWSAGLALIPMRNWIWPASV
jgi:hypothetical protein